MMQNEYKALCIFLFQTCKYASISHIFFVESGILYPGVPGFVMNSNN